MDFDNGRPYAGIMGELVADFVTFGKLVEAWRPEIAAIAGTYHLTIDAAAGSAILGKLRPDGTIVLVERVLVNPQEPATFGASALPVAANDGETRTH